MMEAAAFAPGHVTCFFEIHDAHPDPVRKGSRGAGFSVAQGVVSHVRAEPAEQQRVEVRLDGQPAEAPVTSAAARRLLGPAKLHVRVDSQVQLPVGQGFGMSGAGALSAALALARCLKLPKSDAIVAAHTAEVQQRTGLGDVVAQVQGGIEVRSEPGLPPWGAVQRVVGEAELVLCVLAGPLSTPGVLEDEGRRAAINKAGRACMQRFLEHPNVKNLFRLGKEFSVKSGLASEQVLRAVRACEREGGMATQSMLGHSIVAYGEPAAMEAALKDHGPCTRSRIEPTGARLVEVRRMTREPG
jgi:pantoate kinase